MGDDRYDMKDILGGSSSLLVVSSTSGARVVSCSSVISTSPGCWVDVVSSGAFSTSSCATEGGIVAIAMRIGECDAAIGVSYGY